MSVSFTNELNEIVIFGLNSAPRGHNTHKKSQKSTTSRLEHSIKHPGQHFIRSHQADKGAPGKRSSTQKALRFAELISPISD